MSRRAGIRKATVVEVDGGHTLVTFFLKGGRFQSKEVSGQDATHYLVQARPPAFITILEGEPKLIVAREPKNYCPEMRGFMREYIRRKMAEGFTVVHAHERVRVSRQDLEGLLGKMGRIVVIGHHYLNEKGAEPSQR